MKKEGNRFLRREKEVTAIFGLLDKMPEFEDRQRFVEMEFRNYVEGLLGEIDVLGDANGYLEGVVRKRGEKVWRMGVLLGVSWGVVAILVLFLMMGR